MRTALVALSLVGLCRLSLADSSPPTPPTVEPLQLTHQGRGISIRRGKDAVYFPLPKGFLTPRGSEPDPDAFHDEGAFNGDPRHVYLSLGPSVAGKMTSTASRRALEVYFERTLAASALRRGKPAEAIARLERALTVANMPHDDTNECEDFVQHDWCDPAPIIYSLALAELQQGHSRLARARLRPLAGVNGVRLVADLLSTAELAPLLRLPEVDALLSRSPMPPSLVSLKEHRGLVVVKHRWAAFYLPAAAGDRASYREGSPSSVSFHSMHEPCENAWYCDGYAGDYQLDLEAQGQLAEKLISLLGFDADPLAPPPRRMKDASGQEDLVWDLPSVHARARRTPTPTALSCGDNLHHAVSWEDLPASH